MLGRAPVRFLNVCGASSAGATTQKWMQQRLVTATWQRQRVAAGAAHRLSAGRSSLRCPRTRQQSRGLATSSQRRHSVTPDEAVLETTDDGRVRGVKLPPKILITGAFGRIGRAVVSTALRTQPKWSFCLLSRRGGPLELEKALRLTGRCELLRLDLATQVAVPSIGPDVSSVGLAIGAQSLVDQAKQERELWAALKNVTAVLHLASDVRSRTVDVESTQNLTNVCFAAGVKHVMFVSIVGCDAIPLTYYQTKRQAEEIVSNSGVPFTILRTTQLHSLVDSMMERASRAVPLVMPLPAGFKVQSIADEEVAAHIVESLALGPRGALPDLAGPAILSVREAAAQWKIVHRVRKPCVSVPILGKVGRAFREGNNTTVEPHTRGLIPWGGWLASRAASDK